MIDTIKRFQQEDKKYDAEDDEVWCVFDVDDYRDQNERKFMK
jgi:hypothetical protein